MREFENKLSPASIRPAGPLDDIRGTFSAAQDLAAAVNDLADRLVGYGAAEVPDMTAEAPVGLLYELSYDARAARDSVNRALARIAEIRGAL